MINVYFYSNNTPSLIDPDYIVGLSQQVEPYGETLKLGLTICRVFKVTVLRDAFSVTTPPPLMPDKVVLTEDGSGTEVNYATLYVDSVDDTNEAYYVYTLVDDMMKLGNGAFEWTTNTVENVIQQMCTYYGVTWGGTLHSRILGYRAPYVSGVNGRDFLKYVGEVGCYNFFFNADGELLAGIVPGTNAGTISKDECSSFKVGNRHKITRVVYDNGLDKYEYKADPDDGDTIYLDANNIFLGGSNTQSRLNFVGGRATNIDVYDLTVDQCPVLPNVRAGRLLTIGGTPTFTTFKWNYNGGWVGGYQFSVDTSSQEETQVIDPIDKVQADVRNLNVHVQVDRVKGEVRITNQEDNPPTNYISLMGDGMRIYVDDEQVAEGTANRFNCDKGLGVQDWVMEQGAPETVMVVYRRKT